MIKHHKLHQEEDGYWYFDNMIMMDSLWKGELKMLNEVCLDLCVQLISVTTGGIYYLREVV